MERKVRVDVYSEKALRINASFQDFDGDVTKWKESFYTVWRYQMTWSFAHEIFLVDRRSSGVNLVMICKPKHKEDILNMMEDLGYRNVFCDDEDIGTIECTEFPDDMLIETVIVDY